MWGFDSFTALDSRIWWNPSLWKNACTQRLVHTAPGPEATRSYLQFTGFFPFLHDHLFLPSEPHQELTQPKAQSSLPWLEWWPLKRYIQSQTPRTHECKLEDITLFFSEYKWSTYVYLFYCILFCLVQRGVITELWNVQFRLEDLYLQYLIKETIHNSLYNVSDLYSTHKGLFRLCDI